MGAAYKGDTPTVITLIDNKGVPVDTRDTNQNTALMHAANGGHRETVQALLDRGAVVTMQALDGVTALDCAKPDCLDLLLAHKRGPPQAP